MATVVAVGAPTTASATSVSKVTVGANPPTPGAAASYPISYTPATSLSQGSTITVETAPGTTFLGCSTTATCSGYKIAQSSAYKSVLKVAVQAAGGSATTNEFVVTLGLTTIQSGKSVTLVAQGSNPSTSGSKTLDIWTSKDPSPNEANYTIGTPRRSLNQGAIPQASTAPQLDESSPAYLQSLFGAPTESMPTLVTAYLSGSTWNQMDGASGGVAFLKNDGWSSSNNQPTPGYQLVLGVPILPSNNGKVSLQDGANKDYNSYFHQLALSLINEGLGSSWLRLGFEFDNHGLFGPSKPWGTSNNATEEGYFAQYWQQIVTTMRGVTGANFKFVWNPDGFAFMGNSDPEYLKSGGFSLLPAWPGPQYVDYIGANVYDWEPSLETGYTQTENWSLFLEPQLQAAEQFAQSVGLPLAIPEWGVMTRGPVFAGMGDDPSYITGMYCFMTNAANNVAWESYSNTSYSDWDTQITGSSFPTSLTAFREDFGQGATSGCSAG